VDHDFDLGIAYQNDISDDFIRPFVDEIDVDGIKVKVDSHEPTVWAGIGWFLPTAIMLFITRKYFDTFLQEMAKDHYKLLKGALGKLIKRTIGPERQFATVTLVSRVSPLKTKDDFEGLSVYAVLASGQRVKFVLESNTPGADLDLCADGIVDVLREHYQCVPERRFDRGVRGGPADEAFTAAAALRRRDEALAAVRAIIGAED
jgi:hypothetical protein